MEPISYFLAPSDSQSFRNGAHQFRLDSKGLTMIQKWSISIYTLLKMTHNDLKMERVSFILLQMTLIIKKWNASVSSVFQMIHHHSKTERISKAHTIIQKRSVSLSSSLRMIYNHSEIERISFFFAPNDSQLFRNGSLKFFLAPSASQSFKNGAHQFLLCFKSLITIQQCSASVSFLLQMIHSIEKWSVLDFFLP